ncbi:hypothetical protein U1Q18_005174 [Sarracenia purpurea var. burkii]
MFVFSSTTLYVVGLEGGRQCSGCGACDESVDNDSSDDIMEVVVGWGYGDGGDEGFINGNWVVVIEAI